MSDPSHQDFSAFLGAAGASLLMWANYRWGGRRKKDEDDEHDHHTHDDEGTK